MPATRLPVRTLAKGQEADSRGGARLSQFQRVASMHIHEAATQLPSERSRLAALISARCAARHSCEQRWGSENNAERERTGEGWRREGLMGRERI